MQHTIPHYDFQTINYGYWDDQFTDSELDWLQKKALNANTTATVGDVATYKQNLDIRRTDIAWLDVNVETQYIYDKIANIVALSNVQWFKYDITGLDGLMQLGNYKSVDEGKYDWHIDKGSVYTRKLSVIVQLTCPTVYAGGDLQLFCSSNPLTVEKKRGRVVVFPSWVLHRVTPVVSGSRQSLVAWVTGPSFR
jgi:PKHD-type hydroxylase